jgi:ribokinase
MSDDPEGRAEPLETATAGRGVVATPAVVVVGSLNLDYVVPVPRHPRPGETVLGGDLARHPGGKGANQAVAAARLDQPVAMVGRVGEDEPGRLLTATLADAGGDASGVQVTRGAPTGVALITVDEAGENAIVVSPGANARLSGADVADRAPLLARAAVTLAQLEVPLEAVEAVARAAGGTLVLNPAPARDLPAELLAAVDLLVPNRGELALLAGAAPTDDLDELARLARSLQGPDAVIVTLGADGALLVDDTGVEHVPPVPVSAVDTTAAGDAFCGALADALVRGEPLGAAVRWANRAAAVTVTRAGAQPALPTRREVEELP